MPGDGSAQLRNSPVGQGAQKGLAVVQHHLPLKLHPHGKGEALGAVFRQIQQPIGAALRRSRRFRRYLPGSPLHLLHKVAHLLPGIQVALGEKLIIGGLHGDFADLQVLGQGPLGGQLFPGCQLPGEDILPQMSVQSLVQGHARGFFQFIGYHNMPQFRVGKPHFRSQSTRRLPSFTSISAFSPVK